MRSETANMIRDMSYSLALAFSDLRLDALPGSIGLYHH